MDIYYYIKKEITIDASDNFTFPIQLDLSEIKIGSYIVKVDSAKNDYISIYNSKNERVAIISSYSNYRRFIEDNPIFISALDFELMLKKILVQTVYYKKNYLNVVKVY